MRYKIVDHFDTNAERFWAVFFDESYNQALYSHLQIRRKVVKIEQMPDGRILRIQKLTPLRDAPALIRRVANGNISYAETLEYTPEDGRAIVRTVPTFMADKLKTKGVFAAKGNGERTTRTWSATCNCSLAFIGSRIEKHIVQEIKISYAKTTLFTRRWLERTAAR